MIEDRADTLDTAGVVGRATELSEISRFLDGAQPSALILEGEPGIGKTMLWQAGVDAARERLHSVLVCRPAEAEAKLGYAALGDLLSAVSDEHVAELDEPQRRALNIALLRSKADGSRADPRAVSLGLLNLLRTLTKAETVIVAIDDVQWLDAASARALDFALRRLEHLPVGLLVSQRVGESGLAYERLFDGRIARLTVGPLPPSQLGQVLREQTGLQLSLHTTTRIHRVSGGNPFYALEITRSFRGQNETFLDDHLAVPSSLQALVGRRIASLPPVTRRALLAASALSAPTIPLIAAATGRRDERVPAIGPAETAGVIEVDLGAVRFTHPLLASAVYADASPEERRKLHRRLAGIVADSEESARHLAMAAEGPDAEVADALEEAARKARSRGALDDAVTLGEQAWHLTPESAIDDRHRRQVEAGAYHFIAGDTGRTRELAAAAAATLPAGLLRARALRQLGTITPNVDEARSLFEQALAEAEGEPSWLARIEGSLVSNCHMVAFEAAAANAHARAGLAYAEQSGDLALRASALMDVAWSSWYLGHGLSADLVQEALDLERFCDPTPVRSLPRMRYAMMLHLSFELDAAMAVYETLAEQARSYGDEPSLSRALTLMSEVECFGGRYDHASTLASEAYRIALQCEEHALRATSLHRVALVEAYRGNVEAAREAGEQADDLMGQLQDLHRVSASAWMLSFLELSAGNPGAAIDHALPVARPLVECDVMQPGSAFALFPNLIEALVAVGELEHASFFLQTFEERAEVSGNIWGLSAAARSRALLEAAGGHFEEALAATEIALGYERLPMPLERGRALLVRGVIQRRAKQRRAARGSLSQALAMFEELGARLWAERARAELARIGGRASGDELTPTEAQVAARAAAGETNREIADALFMSVKTVEANLSRVYRKLDVSSRRQLGGKLEHQT